MPKVSVIIPVYNRENYISFAIDSILSQTFKDFELIVINDGSTDNTLNILENYKDKRIKIINNSQNIGICRSRNKGILEASGEYIAFLDSDDIALPIRLETQVNILEQLPNIVLCGGWVQTFGNKKIIWKYPIDTEELKVSMIFFNPVATSTIMVRKDIFFEKNLFFDPHFLVAEDYDLWVRISMYYNIINIPKVLTLYRVHNTQVSNTKETLYKLEMDWLVQQKLISLLKIEPTQKEKELHLRINSHLNPNFLNELEEWLLKLKKQNDELKIYNIKAFNKVISDRWFINCYCAYNFDKTAFKKFFSSRLFKDFRIKNNLRMFFKFLIKKLVK